MYNQNNFSLPNLRSSKITFTPCRVRVGIWPVSQEVKSPTTDCESTNNDPEIPYPVCIPRSSSTSTDDDTLVEEILGHNLFDTVVANLTFFDETIRVGKTRITASTALIYHFNVTYGDWLCTSILAKCSLHQSEAAAAAVMKRSLCSRRYTRIRSVGGPPPELQMVGRNQRSRTHCSYT